MNKAKNKKNSNLRIWALIWSLGIMGQIGWNIEGQWFNTFVYTKIAKNPSIITAMLICSAAATTLATFLFGTWSDRTGRRRTFISVGYIIWGILTIIFGFTEFIGKEFLLIAGISVVCSDMLVSFFASMATDVGFSTWTTDIMDDKNRGQIGGAIAVQCVLGTMLGTVAGGFLVGKENNYIRLFTVIGLVMISVGVVSLFLFNKKDDVKPSVRGSFSEQFFNVFKLKTFFGIKELVWVNITVAVFFIGYNTYFAYIGNYIIHYLGYTADMMGVIEAIPMVMAMMASIPASGLINKNKNFEVVLSAIIANLIGIAFIFPVRPEDVDTTKFFDFKLWAGIFFIGVSYIVMVQTMKVWTKQLHPVENKGQYEGIWVIFYALIPMIFASKIGETVVIRNGVSAFNEISGQMEYIPDGNIFLVGAVISCLCIIPLLFARKHYNKRLNKKS